jgi:flagellar motor switch protein FliM
MDPESQRALLIQPDRESAGTLPALEDLFRDAARDVRTRIVNRAGADVPVRLGLAQVTTIAGVIDDTDARDGGVFGLFRFHPMGLPGIFVVQGRLLARIVGVLLGEDPGKDPPPYRIRPVTRVEMRFAKRIVEDVLDSLQAAWPMDPKPTLELEAIGTGPRLTSSLTPTTPVIAGSLDFGSPEAPYGLLTVAIPAQAARDLRVPKMAVIPRSVRKRRYNADRVLPLPMEAVAELGRTRMKLHELKALKVGQELALGSGREVEVKVGGKVLFLGEPGHNAGRHSVRLTGRPKES